MPFTATQLFVPGAPGFVWSARMAAAPGMPVLVRDGFVAGTGSMRAAVLGLVKVADREGSGQIAAAARQRYLGEAMWFPTALLLSQGVKWTAMDEFRARAEISGGGSVTSLEFRSGPDGLIESVFAPERVYDDGKHPPALLPWTARILRYGDFHGMKIPTDAVAEWQLPKPAEPEPKRMHSLRQQACYEQGENPLVYPPEGTRGDPLVDSPKPECR